MGHCELTSCLPAPAPSIAHLVQRPCLPQACLAQARAAAPWLGPANQATSTQCQGVACHARHIAAVSLVAAPRLPGSQRRVQRCAWHAGNSRWLALQPVSPVCIPAWRNMLWAQRRPEGLATAEDVAQLHSQRQAAPRSSTAPHLAVQHSLFSIAVALLVVGCACVHGCIRQSRNDMDEMLPLLLLGNQCRQARKKAPALPHPPSPTPVPHPPLARCSWQARLHCNRTGSGRPLPRPAQRLARCWRHNASCPAARETGQWGCRRTSQGRTEKGGWLIPPLPCVLHCRTSTEGASDRKRSSRARQPGHGSHDIPGLSKPDQQQHLTHRWEEHGGIAEPLPRQSCGSSSAVGRLHCWRCEGRCGRQGGMGERDGQCYQQG